MKENNQFSDDGDDFIKQKFNESWNKSISNLSSDQRLDELGWTYCENISSTFQSVNPIMPEITYHKFKNLQVSVV